MVKMLHLPEVKGVQDTKTNLSSMLQEMTDNGKTYLIKGTHDRTALMIGVEAFRELQESYLDLAGQVEAMKALLGEDREALRAAASEAEDVSSGNPLTSSDIKDGCIAGTHVRW